MLRSGMKSLTCIANTKPVSLNNLKAFRYKTRTSATNIRCFSAASEINTVIATSAQTGTPDTSTIIQVPDVPLVDNSIVDAITTIDSSAIVGSFYPSHIVMQLVDGIHTFTGIPYWEAIIALTVGIRIVLGPLAIKSVQNAARMGAVRPVMQKVTEANDRNPNKDDPRVQQIFNNEVKMLWKNYKVNPLSAMAMPLAQIPVFLFLFSGLREMGKYYPLHDGGAYWFTDLTMADPYYIFPVVNAISFLAMIEMGADGIKTDSQDTFKWGMRGLAVTMVPMTYSMPSAIFMYWSANNAISIAQTLILKQDNVREYFGIPKPPVAAATPAFKMSNPFRNMIEGTKREFSQNADIKATIVDQQPPPPPPGPEPLATTGAPLV
eukprot:CAMPEP_0119042738 /NCGR_PEP_ID=MMETSP1177-20130426/16122_1 /TAXON_ID=2985 /ORGANISM="Ochromonas sp, Strain CCMP1899" /LENGTH=377 /DNA_ID=CAMNT_0007009725 /DNA_START=119 /DNA_END=1249 /DNA_ORIENTATION=+